MGVVVVVCGERRVEYSTELLYFYFLTTNTRAEERERERYRKKEKSSYGNDKRKSSSDDTPNTHSLCLSVGVAIPFIFYFLIFGHWKQATIALMLLSWSAFYFYSITEDREAEKKDDIWLILAAVAVSN